MPTTKTARGKAARKETAKGKSAEEQAAKLVGKDYVASDFDVSRKHEDGPQKGQPYAKRVLGGRLLDDIDEELSEDEEDSLRAAGVIRPATLPDARATIARDAADEARGRNRETLAERAKVRQEFESDRIAVRAKHDAARDEELRKIDVKEAEELAAIDAKAAEAAGGANAPSDKS